MEIAQELCATYSMLENAFPNGITEAQYWHVLKLLYDNMSDRQLAETLSAFTNQNSTIIYSNDIPNAYQMDFSNNLSYEETKRLLLEHGYSQWLTEA